MTHEDFSHEEDIKPSSDRSFGSGDLDVSPDSRSVAFVPRRTGPLVGAGHGSGVRAAGIFLDDAARSPQQMVDEIRCSSFIKSLIR